MRRDVRAIGLAFCFYAILSFAEPVHLAGNDSRPPKTFIKDGHPQGILVDIVNYLHKVTGQEFSIELYPLARALMVANSGKSGFIGLSKSDERLQHFDFGDEVLFYDEVVVVVMAGKEFPFTAPSDLTKKRIGVVRGARYGPDFENLLKSGQVNFVETSTLTQQLAMMAAGRLDAVLVSAGKAGLSAARGTSEATTTIPKDAHFVILPTPFTRDATYIAFHKSANKKTLLKDLDMALKKGYSSGEVPSLINAYIEPK